MLLVSRPGGLGILDPVETVRPDRLATLCIRLKSGGDILVRGTRGDLEAALDRDGPTELYSTEDDAPDPLVRVYRRLDVEEVVVWGPPTKAKSPAALGDAVR